MSKGSGRRPTNNSVFEENFDRIFNAKPNSKQFEGINNGNKPNTKNTKETTRKRRVQARSGSRKMEPLGED